VRKKGVRCVGGREEKISYVLKSGVCVDEQDNNEKKNFWIRKRRGRRELIDSCLFSLVASFYPYPPVFDPLFGFRGSGTNQRIVVT
jgi:hypothetical protein